MRKLIEDKGEAILATTVVAFGVGYSIGTCDYWSFLAGFTAGAAAIVAAVMWLE